MFVSFVEGEEMADFSMSSADWAKMWTEGKTDFHSDKLCDFFIKHVAMLINDRQGIKIFVPLCGKAVEMKWLWENGHEIVGVECGEVALKQFFEEQKIEFSVDEIPSIEGKLYKSKDNKIRPYCCDMYKFSSSVECGFDAVWDCGALNAINLDDQEKYIHIIKSIMGDNCINLTIIDDVVDWEIPVNFEKLKIWFKDGYIVTSSDYIPANDELKSLGIKGQQLYCIAKT